ncbi:MAG TPA: SUMF1/EgtB/PvdO family nonheme iron enzyme, partial [Polyangiaceae bacterium]
MRYCIDRYEYTRPGEGLPVGGASFNDASRVCSALGKRICSEAEWNFACEGEQMLPYPYGFSRAEVCNQDRRQLLTSGLKGQVLRDWREPSTG